MAILTKESEIFIEAKLMVSKSTNFSTRAPMFYDFLNFKGCSYVNYKISFNLNVQVAIFLFGFS